MNRILLVIVFLLTIISYLLYNQNIDSKNDVQIRVFFGDKFQNEKSKIQSFDDWYTSKNDNTFTLEELYRDGWKLVNVLKTNASAVDWQVSIFMEISNDNYELVKDKYMIKNINKNEVVPNKDGL